jgi:hypothetical protein
MFITFNYTVIKREKKCTKHKNFTYNLKQLLIKKKK